MNVVERCLFCGKPATKLCDAPIGRQRFCGHPPRHIMQKAKMCDMAFVEVTMQKTITCDAPMCDSCAVSVFPEIDYCPRCVQEIKNKSAMKKVKVKI